MPLNEETKARLSTEKHDLPKILYVKMEPDEGGPFPTANAKGEDLVVGLDTPTLIGVYELRRIQVLEKTETVERIALLD